MVKKKTNGHGDQPPIITEIDLKDVIKKVDEGLILNSEDLELIMKKSAQDLRELGNVGPINYISDLLGVDRSVLNSYFFASYGIFQKDLTNKTNPYIAYTVAIIHALSLGYFLGSLNGKGGKHGPDTTSKAVRKTKSTKPGK
ncbi:MAG: hypothetical protein A2V69_01080 [Candidatus Portnoybacteria bacterium RBG_13_40_8]|uniref:Uncharacterized protein n=1 Tax=Candidatus Portnoybacteria bacterium RBG_13_40_8 TaxID=1801990 RepID=A0A1G2F3E9_9BACT|nr:MAG: hypothetical protein A2V69_01080 [Candidatus Portnoybacteria bacterium RBG_13_40_8]